VIDVLEHAVGQGRAGIEHVVAKLIDRRVHLAAVARQHVSVRVGSAAMINRDDLAVIGRELVGAYSEDPAERAIQLDQEPARDASGRAEFASGDPGP